MTLKEPTRRQQRLYCYGGITMIVVGVCCVLVSLVAHYYIPHAIAARVTDTVVIASDSHPHYAEFVSNAGEEAPEKLNKFYFYHLLNADQFLNSGQAPRFQERGPYTFQERYRHHNVTFSADGSLVSYADAVTNTFRLDLSNGTLGDQMTILNLAYFKLMATVGSESQFARAGATQVLGKAMAQMHDKLVPAVKAGAVAQAVLKAAQALQRLSGNGGWDNLMAIMGGNCPDGQCRVEQLFLLEWVVGDVTPLLQTNICPCQQPQQNCTTACPLAIPGEQFSQLMNVTDSMAVVNGTKEFGASLWLEEDPAKLETSAESITQHFNISRQQFDRVRAWLVRVSQLALIRDKVFEKLNADVAERHVVHGWDDLPARQWLLGDVLARLQGGADMVSVAPDAPVELPFYFLSNKNKQQDTNDPATAESLDWSLETVRCLTAVLNSNKSATLEMFANVTAKPAWLRPTFADVENAKPPPGQQTVDECLRNTTQTSSRNSSAAVGMQVLQGYMDHAAATTMRQLLQQALDGGSGLVVTRTVGQHVLGLQEPLLKLVLPPDDPRGQRYAMLQNDDSLDTEPLCHSSADVLDEYFTCERVDPVDNSTSVIFRRHPTTFHTGADTVQRLGQLADYYGHPEIDRVWHLGPNTTLPIYGAVQNSVQFGYGNLASFPPNDAIMSTTQLAVFVPGIPAPLYLEQSQQDPWQDLHGVKLRRFLLPASQFTAQYPHPAYHSPRAGTIDVSDMKGFPLQISPAHFVGFPDRQAELANMTTDLGSGDFEQYGSFLDVEPTTGKTMRVRMRLQSTVSTNAASFDLTHPNVHKTDTMPVAWKEVSSEATPAQAQQLRSQVYTVQNLARDGFLVGLPVGLCFVFAGIALAVVGARMRKRLWIMRP